MRGAWVGTRRIVRGTGAKAKPLEFEPQAGEARLTLWNNAFTPPQPLPWGDGVPGSPHPAHRRCGGFFVASGSVEVAISLANVSWFTSDLSGVAESASAFRLFL